MASPLATRGAIVATGMAIAATGMASAAPRSKMDQQRRSVHGTAVQTQTGMKDGEPAMSSMDVRKAIQGKSSEEKY
ncbi:hypothetical protein EW145_g7342 [Phellinidium pouzarii]|uniref:Uncharacterized protein n=1 Tax=Phellinidium pouzarii TaxID=167371 RepID=A0A4S4KL65_9AGAM|nr:hypothetical protein EW145_g7342 [Phellinidium pouzarii]